MSRAAPILETETVAEVPLQKALLFPLGLPGFPTEHRFALSQEPKEAPFAWLTSLDSPGLAFVVVEPRHVLEGYVFDLQDSELEPIGSPAPSDLALLLILRVCGAQGGRLLANLRAPLLLNLRARLCRQVILGEESGYSESYPIQP